MCLSLCSLYAPVDCQRQLHLIRPQLLVLLKRKVNKAKVFQWSKASNFHIIMASYFYCLKQALCTDVTVLNDYSQSPTSCLPCQGTVYCLRRTSQASVKLSTNLRPTKVFKNRRSMLKVHCTWQIPGTHNGFRKLSDAGERLCWQAVQHPIICHKCSYSSSYHKQMIATKILCWCYTCNTIHWQLWEE